MNAAEKKSARNAAYYVKNKSKILTQKARYFLANAETIVARKIANKELTAKKKAAYYLANKERIAAYRFINKERNAARQAQFRSTKKELIAIRQSEYYKANRERVKEYQAANAERLQKYKAAWRAANKSRMVEWLSANKDRVSEGKAAWRRERMKSDPQFKLLANLRTRARYALKAQRATKLFQSHVRLLGGTPAEARAHIESQFESWMSWENHGQYGWHIDHIKPLAAFDLNDPEQVKQAFHYTNLRPLHWRENLSKGARLNNISKIKQRLKG